MKKTFTATIRDSNIFSFDSPEAWHKHLKTLNGERVFVTVGKWYAKMSDKQRRYYFGVVVKELVDFTGFEKDEIHDYCKAKFNSVQESFTKKSSNETKEKIGDLTITRIRSTTELSTVEMEDYLTKIRNWSGRDLGVYIPLPNELEGTEYGEFYYDLEKKP